MRFYHQQRLTQGRVRLGVVPHDRVWCSVVILILANVTATLMAMAIGAAAPSNSVANMAGSLAIMLFLLFGGFMLNKDQARRMRLAAFSDATAAA